MNAEASDPERIERLIEGYGDGFDGSSPTAAQWAHLLERPADAPVSLVNFFELRARAAYAGGAPPDRAESGQEAFARYSAASGPALERAGGRFLLVAPFDSAFVGADESWDLVAIGSYPGPRAVLALFEDEAYRAAFPHRQAACARQKVLLVG